MKHLYLSPHLDDAVLSCGGAIHRHAARGDTVEVVTFFAADAAPGSEFSAFAEEQHRYWGGHRQPMALRRAEDQAALTLLGARGHTLEYRDAVYRADGEGQWMYVDLDTLMGSVHPGDPLAEVGGPQMAQAVAGLISPEEEALLYAPLGVGRHVDHQLVHRAGRLLLGMGFRVAFFEDYPYAERAGALEAALDVTEAAAWRMEHLALDAADVAAKVSALGYYRSQMAVLFGGGEAMPSRVWAFAASRVPAAGLVERIWWPQ